MVCVTLDIMSGFNFVEWRCLEEEAGGKGSRGAGSGGAGSVFMTMVNQPLYDLLLVLCCGVHSMEWTAGGTSTIVTP